MRTRLRNVGVLSIVAASMLTGLGSAAAAAPEGAILGTDSPDRIAGSYIVVLADSPTLAADGVPALAQRLASKNHGSVEQVYQSALQGFATRMTEADARRLAADPAVEYVQQNQTLSLSDTETSAAGITGTQPNPPSWGLDRVDQRALPLSNSYTYPNTAASVHAYVIDTGIRFTHETFGGRAVSGRDTVDNDNDATDCNGHGTHVSGTIGGREYGIAKGVQIVGVRVLNCGGSGTTAQVVAGIDWVTDNAIKPAVANMSLGGGSDAALDDAVAGSIASGVTYAIAAGNGNLFGQPRDACNTSPARVPAALTVGATKIDDGRARFSNFGTCLDVFAPGVGITSSWNGSDTDTNTIDGTSMAAPHVAGAVALWLSAHPTDTPAQVRAALVARGTNGVVKDPRDGSPNRLLYVGSMR